MVIPADVSTWTQNQYPREAKCYCGHTAYWHMWSAKDQISVCDDADYVPPGSDKEPCGCHGFAWPEAKQEFTQGDVLTPETLWTCFLGEPQCGSSGHGPDSLHAHLDAHKAIITDPGKIAVSIGYGETP